MKKKETVFMPGWEKNKTVNRVVHCSLLWKMKQTYFKNVLHF